MVAQAIAAPDGEVNNKGREGWGPPEKTRPFQLERRSIFSPSNPPTIPLVPPNPASPRPPPPHRPSSPGTALSGIELAGGSKRLQVQWVPGVAPDTTALRCLDWDRDRFDIEFALTDGTTYNSYLIFGAGATALVDASHEKFRGLYLPGQAAAG